MQEAADKKAELDKGKNENLKSLVAVLDADLLVIVVIALHARLMFFGGGATAKLKKVSL